MQGYTNYILAEQGYSNMVIKYIFLLCNVNIYTLLRKANEKFSLLCMVVQIISLLSKATQIFRLYICMLRSMIVNYSIVV